MNALPENALQIKADKFISNAPKGVRTEAIAKHLKISLAAVTDLLQPLVDIGHLLACRIERPGKHDVHEYRAATSQGTAFIFETPAFIVKPNRQSKQVGAPPIPAKARRKQAKPFILGTAENPSRNRWPSKSTAAYKAFEFIEKNPGAEHDSIAKILDIERKDVGPYLHRYRKNGALIVVAVKATAHRIKNTYYLPEHAPPGAPENAEAPAPAATVHALPHESVAVASNPAEPAPATRSGSAGATLSANNFAFLSGALNPFPENKGSRFFSIPSIAPHPSKRSST